MEPDQKSLLQSLTSKGDQVSLKGILRGAAAQEPAGMGAFAFPEFNVQGRPARPKPMTEAEIQLQEANNKIAHLEKQLTLQKEESKKQIDQALAKGKAEGLALGITEGESKALLAYNEQISTLRKDIGGVLQSVNDAYGNRIQEIEEQCFELALGIGKKIWSVEAETHPEKIAEILNEAFSHLGQAESVVVHLHPLDVKVANETQSLWQPINSALKSVQIESDERVERGGCWVESAGGGTVDLRHTETWQRIEDLLRNAHAKQGVVE